MKNVVVKMLVSILTRDIAIIFQLYSVYRDRMFNVINTTIQVPSGPNLVLVLFPIYFVSFRICQSYLIRLPTIGACMCEKSNYRDIHRCPKFELEA